tara:strand:+ start:848 stop:1141 length:294 start_codon:yes stop_codon:yes gene_type:complete
MAYKDNFELTYTNEHGETMTLKLDDKNNILIKHDDISATSNFVRLTQSFFKKYILNENEQNALLLQIKALSEFGKSRLANNIPCSLGLDYEFQYQSE